MKLVHITDIHLDSVPGSIEEAGRLAIRGAPADAVVLLTGDLATAASFPNLLPAFAAGLGRRVYFLLGNHDAWEGSVEGARRSARKLSLRHHDITYLAEAGVIELSPTTALCGIDGWYDGRAGACNTSSVHINDWMYVAELRGLHRDRRREVFEVWAQRNAARAREVLEHALARYDHVIFGTHVPPFPQTSVDLKGHPSDPEHLPWYCNVTLGFTLDALAASYPHRRITVLAGHCHGPADVAIAPNLRAITGSAVRGCPAIAGMHEIV